MSIGSKGIIDCRAHKIQSKFIEAPSGAIPTVPPIIISPTSAERIQGNGDEGGVRDLGRKYGGLEVC